MNVVAHELTGGRRATPNFPPQMDGANPRTGVGSGAPRFIVVCPARGVNNRYICPRMGARV